KLSVLECFTQQAVWNLNFRVGITNSNVQELTCAGILCPCQWVNLQSVWDVTRVALQTVALLGCERDQAVRRRQSEHLLPCERNHSRGDGNTARANLAKRDTVGLCVEQGCGLQ